MTKIEQKNHQNIGQSLTKIQRKFNQKMVIIRLKMHQNIDQNLTKNGNNSARKNGHNFK